MKFHKIIYSGDNKIAYGHDENGAPIVREFPYSMSDSEIFALGEKKPPKEPKVEPPKEPKVEPPKEPEKNDLPNVDDTTAEENPNAKTKK
jgi:hypothetical protein